MGATARDGQAPAWLGYLDLACAATAGAAWYLRPSWGPWPLALALAPWLARWALTGRPSRRTPLDLPLALFLATAGMGVWAAFDPETAWAKLWIVVGAAAIYYALANQPSTRHLRAFATLYALFGAVIAVYFLWTNNWIHGKAKIEALTELGKAIQAALPPFSGHQMQPNVVGGMLAAIVPFQLAMLVSRRRKGRQIDADGRRFSWWALGRLAAGAALAVTAFGLVLTTSRGAWLALGASLGLWGLWKASGIGRGKSRENRTARFATLAAAAVLAAGTGLLLFPGGPRGALSLVPGQNQLPDRVSLWQRALYLIQDTPFTGGGLGSFPVLDSAYAYPITDWIGFRVYIWLTNAHSHNLWLDVAVEQGLAGLAALLGLQVAFVATVWRGRRAAAGQDGAAQWGGLLVEAAVASALVMAIHGLVDDVPYGSRAMLLFLVPMGVVVAMGNLPPLPRPLSPRKRGEQSALAAGVPAAVILVGLAAVVWGRPLAAAWQADLGAVALAKVELAGYLDEGYELYRARAEGDFGAAAARLEEALALAPGQATASLRLGLMRLGQGQYEAAVPLLEQAYQAQSGRQAARQGLAEAYLAAGRLEESAALWAGVDEAETKLKQLSRMYKTLGEELRATDAAWLATQVTP